MSDTKFPENVNGNISATNDNIIESAMGIYIHIPFCVHKCVYCDFLSSPANAQTHEAYVNALIKEIEYAVKIHANELADFKVKTIFFGGGTPSAIDEKHIVRIMDTIKREFNVDSGAEITIECNPGTLNMAKAVAYRSCGINRISFGVQAADDYALKMLGRIHTFADFEESMQIAREAGFKNINADIMSSLPGQTYESYIHGLKKILSLEPEHISAYSLIVEDGTPLSDNLENYPPLPDEDTEREMYYATREILEKYGYQRYEISNYAKPGFECRHNKSYWERIDYLGFGIGAASLFDNKRMTNITDINQYIKATGSAEVYEEFSELTKQDCIEEFMFLGLRQMRGISFEKFKMQFGTDIMDIYGDTISRNIKKGLMKLVTADSVTKGCEATLNNSENKACETDGIANQICGCALTDRGIDVSNVVLAEFLL